MAEWQEGGLSIAELEARLLAAASRGERQRRSIVAPTSREVIATGLLWLLGSGFDHFEMEPRSSRSPVP
ncbi:MAG: hypothetical protein U5Q44_07705 [Dehalococcoidia bacterium]|nr:hypothetical protein [Dehalococcoidia bacterium]